MAECGFITSAHTDAYVEFVCQMAADGPARVEATYEGIYGGTTAWRGGPEDRVTAAISRDSLGPPETWAFLQEFAVRMNTAWAA